MMPQHASASAWMMRGRQRQRIPAAWAVLLLLASPLLPAALGEVNGATSGEAELTIRNVKCIRPSAGIDAVTQAIFASIAAAAAVPAAIAAAPFTAGTSLVALAGVAAFTGAAVTGAAVGGAAAIKGLDSVFSGTDSLYIKVNGGTIFPTDGSTYQDVTSQNTYDIGYVTPLNKDVAIELFEYDYGSGDDSMGGFTIFPTHQAGDFSTLVQHDGEGSLYIINYRVARDTRPGGSPSSTNGLNPNGHLFGSGYNQYDELEIQPKLQDVNNICVPKCQSESQCTGFGYRIDARFDGRNNGNCWFMSGDVKWVDQDKPNPKGLNGGGVWIK